MSRESPNERISALAANSKMLSAAQVAEHLGLSLTAVYRLARSGAIRSHRMGKGKVRPRGLRFPEVAVEEFLQESLVDAEQAA